MRPANDPNVDYHKMVEQGYEQCAAAYEAARRGTTQPELQLLTQHLKPGATVLDLGCGAGVPIANTLAENYQVTGIDLSAEQIRRARANVPRGAFIQADMLYADFPDATYDAIVAFYTIFHLPCEQHFVLLQQIHRWLKTGGYLLATVSQYNEAAYTEDDFFGVTMYWSNYSLKEYQTLLRQIGFQLLDTTFQGRDYSLRQPGAAEFHPLIFAQKQT